MKLQTDLTESWDNENFPDIIRSVYISTSENDRGLRDLVASNAAKHIHSLTDREDFKSVIGELHELTVDVLYLATKETQQSPGFSGLRF